VAVPVDQLLAGRLQTCPVAFPEARQDVLAVEIARSMNQRRDHNPSMSRCWAGTCSAKVEYWPLRPFISEGAQFVKGAPKAPLTGIGT